LNELLQVKVKNWVDGKEGDMLNAMTARFGSVLPEDADQSIKSPLVSSIPADCCSLSTAKVDLETYHIAYYIIVVIYSNQCGYHMYVVHYSYLDQLLFVFVVLVTSQLKLHSHSQGALLPC
jgi:hypothetical protein